MHIAQIVPRLWYQRRTTAHLIRRPPESVDFIEKTQTTKVSAPRDWSNLTAAALHIKRQLVQCWRAFIVMCYNTKMFCVR